MTLFQLPLEIRLSIYSELFGNGIAHVDGGRQDIGVEAESPNMLPAITQSPRLQQRSAQLLRTCKAVLAEARPVLYENTIFRTSYQAFAGRLPVKMTNGNLCYPYVRHLEWSLDCDILKKFIDRDVCIRENDARYLQTVQLTCQAENWKGSFCGEWCDREMFVQGRQQVTDFAKLLQASMSGESTPVNLVEDTRFLSRGRVVLRLSKGGRAVGPTVSY